MLTNFPNNQKVVHKPQTSKESAQIGSLNGVDSTCSRVNLWDSKLESTPLFGLTQSLSPKKTSKNLTPHFHFELNPPKTFDSFRTPFPHWAVAKNVFRILFQRQPDPLLQTFDLNPNCTSSLQAPSPSFRYPVMGFTCHQTQTRSRFETLSSQPLS